MKKKIEKLFVTFLHPTWKHGNIYVKIYEIYFRKEYNKNIFCMYFLYKSKIYLPKNIWYIFDIYYSKALEIYFHATKLYMSRIHIFYFHEGQNDLRLFVIVLRFLGVNYVVY